MPYKRFGHQSGQPQERDEPKLPPPAGSPVTSITLRELKHSNRAKSSSKSLAIQSTRAVTSYNWIDETSPSICVPGGPPHWTHDEKCVKLPEDSGDYYKDLNAARSPQYPLEPSVQALLISGAASKTPRPDVFACSHTMTYLWKFLRKSDKEFRFLVDTDGNTTFFIRREVSPDQKLVGVRGYGHTFPDHNLTWSYDLRKSMNNTQLMSYQLGGLDFLIRTGCDGVFDREKAPQPRSRSSQDLSGHVSNIVLDKPERPASGTLRITKLGEPADWAGMFDIKTRSIKKLEDNVLDQEMARLWLSQIPNLILAYHKWGTFSPQNVHTYGLQERWSDWELENRDAIARLVALVEKLINIAESWPYPSPMEVRYDGSGDLCVYVQTQYPEAAMLDSSAVKWEGAFA